MSSPVREHKLPTKLAAEIWSGSMRVFRRTVHPAAGSGRRVAQKPTACTRATSKEAAVMRSISVSESCSGRRLLHLRDRRLRGACRMPDDANAQLDGSEALSTQPIPVRPIRSRLIGTQDHFSANIGGGIAIGVIAGLITGLQIRRQGQGHEARHHRRAHRCGRGLSQGQARAGPKVVKICVTPSTADVQRDTHKVTEMGSILRNLNECRQSQVVASAKHGFDDGGVTARETKAVLQTGSRQRAA